MRFKILICFITSLFSCSGTDTTITDMEIEKFISKYEEIKFDQVKNISISQRSRNVNEIVYVVGKAEGNLPVYFVTFNLQKREVTDINRKNLEKSKVKDYLTQDEIINAVSEIRNHDFYFLAVDSLENVYINPYYVNEPPFLLRLKIATGDSVVKRGYAYELYKGRWYLNRSRRKS